uniref:Uncharacterized protein n=1 Tax=Rhizophagus irregularis (strain DAOM 181602 / DAOM 197198 / MUCL 43194) TaxID=747089 RepID=U9T568_RHIID
MEKPNSCADYGIPGSSKFTNEISRHAQNEIKKSTINVEHNVVRQARGRTPKWFDTLLGLVQQSSQLKDLCKISVESSNSESESGMDRGISINIQAIKDDKKSSIHRWQKKGVCVYTAGPYVSNRAD